MVKRSSPSRPGKRARPIPAMKPAAKHTPPRPWVKRIPLVPAAACVILWILLGVIHSVKPMLAYDREFFYPDIPGYTLFKYKLSPLLSQLADKALPGARLIGGYLPNDAKYNESKSMIALYALPDEDRRYYTPSDFINIVKASKNEVAAMKGKNIPSILGSGEALVKNTDIIIENEHVYSYLKQIGTHQLNNGGSSSADVLISTSYLYMGGKMFVVLLVNGFLSQDDMVWNKKTTQYFVQKMHEMNNSKTFLGAFLSLGVIVQAVIAALVVFGVWRGIVALRSRRPA